MGIDRNNVHWPDGTSDTTIELASYRIARDGYNTGKAAWEHMLAAAQLLFTPQQYAIHEWVPRRMKAFCEHPWQTWIGPGATAKSTDAAVCVLLHWLSAPEHTTCVVCSTTAAMLEKRILGELIRYYSLIPDAPGAYRRSESSIVLDTSQSSSSGLGVNSKNGIFGVAILKGSTREALGNIVGMHNKYVVLIVDEMQATREAAVEAATNLGSSGKEFIFLGMGNPETRLDPLGRYSTPVAGWEQLHPDTCGVGWETPYGWCEFFDGLECPNVVNPGKWPFLLSQKAIDETIKSYGIDSPQYWSQRRGFFPPEGLERTLFTPSLFSSTGSYGSVTWKFEPIPVAGMDPAFSSLGDRCILQFGLWGPDKDSVNRLLLTETVPINLVTGGKVPISTMIAEQVEVECMKRGVIPENLGVDCTGSQVTLADSLDTLLKGHVHRVQFGGKPSDLPLNDGDETPASKLCRNRVTELWVAMHSFVKSSMVRGLSETVVPELCARRLVGPLHPMQVEPKTQMKQRFGASPDEADAHAALIDLLRVRFGVVPSVSPDFGQASARDYERACVEADIDSSPDGYLQSWESASMLL